MGKADERLLALWHALDSTELGLTKQEIRQLVPGYGTESNLLAFEKMFTRDKNALRELGTVLETRLPGTGPERYKLMATATPAVELTPAEAAATRLAASFWAVGDLGVEADHAARKVTGRDAQAGLLVPHIPASGLLLRPLLNAIGQRQRVEFGYRSGVTGKVSTRVVEPWQVAFRDGGWYLLGHDNERGGPRAFRLSRVAGGTATVSRPGAFPIPEKIDVADLLGETTHSVTALIALAPGRGARLRAFGELIFDDAAATRHQDDDASSAAEEYEQLYDFPPGFGLVRYRYDDEREFADELAGLGAQVVVLAPAQLRAAVLKRLESARDLAKQIGR